MDRSRSFAPLSALPGIPLKGGGHAAIDFATITNVAKPMTLQDNATSDETHLPLEGRWPGAQRAVSSRVRYALPISTPAAKTNAPPSTTWKAARRKGVSMNRFWMKAMAQSSKNTTIAATVVAVQKCGMR